MNEGEIQTRIQRVSDYRIKDKDLTSQDFALRTLLYAWMITSGWTPPKETT